MAHMSLDHRVYLSVGSNLGDKLDNCLKGLAALTDSGETMLRRVSRFYRTSPVDYTDQDWFVNAAVEIDTGLSPEALLAELLAIQKRMGRKADAIRFGPRVLDLDILLYDDRVIQSKHLILPHPRMHKRAFVLQPICDIDPTIMHPVLGTTMGALLSALDDEDQKVYPLADPPTLDQGRLS
ncbi:2-amino-4-hydroxy-6-hydroxymethyldihydropteridine diphosphokinase [Desulfosarcina variabilis]|uniref:2-amino-4-hydroxy-6- hydroxymethyldihydropteridine diphosphokinase n=1 Tax=Desulfosarcina variabilis TaxID=2300 RepID=UPI003AFAC58A